MGQVNKFAPVWASSAESKTMKLALDEIPFGWKPSDVPIIEFLNYNTKDLMDKLNEIIQLYYNPTFLSFARKDQTIDDDRKLSFGTSADAAIMYTTTTATEQIHIGLPASNHALSICNVSDIYSDLNIVSTDNSIFVHGENTSHYIGLINKNTSLHIQSDSLSPIRLKAAARVVIGSFIGGSHGMSVNDLLIPGELEVKKDLMVKNTMVTAGSFSAKGAYSMGSPVVIDNSQGSSGSHYFPLSEDTPVVVCDTSSAPVYIEIDEVGTDGQLLQITRHGANVVYMTWTYPATSDYTVALSATDETAVWRYTSGLAGGAWKYVGRTD